MARETCQPAGEPQQIAHQPSLRDWGNPSRDRAMNRTATLIRSLRDEDRGRSIQGPSLDASVITIAGILATFSMLPGRYGTKFASGARSVRIGL